MTELFDLNGKTALVTGGSKGLGRTFSETLAEAGAAVALCSRNETEAQEAAQAIAGKTGRPCLGLACDVAVAADVRRVVRAVEDDLGAVDILVANAGVNIRAPVEELSEDEWDQVLDINLKGAFLCAQAVLPGMRQRRWGRLVFLASIMSFASLPARAAYASSKAALLGLTRTLALESARDGVCVNALCPGPFVTPMNQTLTQGEDKKQAMLARMPMGRWGQPDELKGLILCLCSNAASYMTGSAVVADGGWLAQ
jgi:NAD(P)-dependent dehydrogenase (short-subunit alcohol dehydrogenase family)